MGSPPASPQSVRFELNAASEDGEFEEISLFRTLFFEAVLTPPAAVV